MENQKALARANGTARGASGWAGEKDAHVRITHPPSPQKWMERRRYGKFVLIAMGLLIASTACKRAGISLSVIEVGKFSSWMVGQGDA